MKEARSRLGLTLMLLSSLDAFQQYSPLSSLIATKYGIRKRVQSAARGDSRLQVSLDDSWEKAAEALKVAADSANKFSLPAFQLPDFTLPSAATKLPEFDAALLQNIPFPSNPFPDLFSTSSTSPEWIASVLSTVTSLEVFYSTLPVSAQIVSVVIPLLAILLSTLYSWSFPPPDYRAGMEPYVRGNYDPIQAKAYYARHQFMVLQRCLQLLRLSNKFILNLLLDKYIWKKEEENRAQRADELLTLVTKLGPTAIKVGQALSVRPDLIPYEYANALASLQDQVPPFDGSEAKQALLQQLGRERFRILERMSFDQGPIASGSIGQVYKGMIGDKQVAVKVQRPNVLAEIALDLYIVREFAPIYQKFTGGATDLQSLANEWGRGFIAELDYRSEAENTIRFNQEMQKRNLNAVCAPVVLEDFTTEQILVTEWVDGTRLDQSDAADVPRLCSVALNAYLVMLLELQSLHCDPHPGNLLRTTDGRLCILDFGMTLDIDPSLQYSLLEYVAHLTSGNYGELADDLVKLGFIKPEKADFIRRSGVLEPLKYFLKQAGEGGGAKSVRDRIFNDYREKYPGLTDDELRIEMRAEMKQRMKQVVEQESVATGITIEVEELQRRNRDSFMIPEWFLYTSRAFLTLEGVSLQADENYSIIKSCFPYVAKRLVADDDPRARKALRDLIYGASNAINVDRLTDLADGFSSYTTTTKTINQQAKGHEGELVLANGQLERISKDRDRKKKMVEVESTITLVKDSADIFLVKEDNLMQNLFVEESVLAASARFKDSVRDALVDGPKRFREALPLGIGSFLPPLPFEAQVEPFVRKTPEEARALVLAEKIANLVPQRQVGAKETSINGNVEAGSVFIQNLRELEPEQAALVVKEIRENLPKYAPLVGRLGNKFVSTLFKTANINIEQTLSELEKEGRSPDPIFRATVQGLANVAERGASALAPTPTSNKSPAKQR